MVRVERLPRAPHPDATSREGLAIPGWSLTGIGTPTGSHGVSFGLRPTGSARPRGLRWPPPRRRQIGGASVIRRFGDPVRVVGRSSLEKIAVT